MTRLDEQLITGKLETIKSYLEELRQFQSQSKETFLADPKNYALAEHYLEHAIEAILDACRGLVIALELKTPDDSHGLFPLLERAGVLSAKFVKRNFKMPGFRNRLVHEYETVDHSQVYQYLQEHFQDFQEFIKQISQYILKD